MASGDISLEPLFNQSAQGSGTSRKPAFVPIDTAGQANDRAAITVTSTSQQITLTVGKRSIEIQNISGNIVYYGGVAVTSARGIKLFPNQTKIFANVKDTFSVYLVTNGADTAECRIVEYD